MGAVTISYYILILSRKFAGEFGENQQELQCGGSLFQGPLKKGRLMFATLPPAAWIGKTEADGTSSDIHSERKGDLSKTLQSVLATLLGMLPACIPQH